MDADANLYVSKCKPRFVKKNVCFNNAENVIAILKNNTWKSFIIVPLVI